MFKKLKEKVFKSKKVGLKNDVNHQGKVRALLILSKSKTNEK